MSVTVNFGGIKRKISSQNVKRGQYAVANQAMADMDRFVPRKERNFSYWFIKLRYSILSKIPSYQSVADVQNM